MKIGIAGANIAAFAERGHAVALARTAEAAGIESLWTYEHIVVPGDYRSAYPYSSSGRMPDARFADALDWIAFLSAVTEYIAFGTGMLISIGIWVNKEIERIRTGNAKDLTAMIEINEIIRDGLT